MQEFKAWKAETAKSARRWTLDQVLYLNQGLFLFYIGGESGHYIQVTKDGEATLGTYAGALPCITDATFTVKWMRNFEDQGAALKYVIERGGMSILLALVMGRSPYAEAV